MTVLFLLNIILLPPKEVFILKLIRLEFGVEGVGKTGGGHGVGVSGEESKITETQRQSKLNGRELHATDSQKQLPTSGGQSVTEKRLSARDSIALNPESADANISACEQIDALIERLSVDDQRITTRFEQPTKTIERLKGLPLGAGGRFQIQTADSEAHDLTRFEKSINTYLKLLSKVFTLSNTQNEGREILVALNEVINDLNAIADNVSPKWAASEDNKKWLNNCRDQLNNERKLVLQVMQDKDIDLPDGSVIDWQAMIELKRTGYEITPETISLFGGFSDLDVVKGSEKCFGNGSFHTVYKLTYQSAEGEVSRIFKAEDAVDISNYYKENHVALDNYLDTQRPKFAARNIATLKVQEHLGLDLLPGMTLSTHDGKLGLLMEEAEGYRLVGYAVEDEGDEKYTPEIPLNDSSKPDVSATIRKNLIRAEWLDGVCGQYDRHFGNLFIDPDSGRVTLIDNDLSFFPGLLNVKYKMHPDPSLRRSGSRAGWPPVIDDDLFTRLMNLDEKALAQDLKGLLTEREINATLSRIHDLQEHANGLAEKGLIISDWGLDNTYGIPPKNTLLLLKRAPNDRSYYRNMLQHLNHMEDIDGTKPVSFFRERLI
ncbi:hypothetical protein [uncultured Endozoicomonas sp.]|uniref:hypothetical protein n=1 Tax=uncultured Endozoicomonas sp. TaxID=432652 RepID=UPI002614B8CA|nr:hypothetical protein [uncultured Endozoicomonas sp.]